MMRTLLPNLKRSLLAAALVALAALPGQAQTNRRHFCATDEHAAHLESQVPGLAQSRAWLDDYIRRMAHTAPSARNGRMSRIVPTVVHVIHQYGAENVSKESIMAMLNQFNADMARRNRDTNSPRTLFQSIASDMDMEFRLVTKDPNGNATDGITRIDHPLTVLNPNNRDLVKTVRTWASDRYFNIWIVNTIENNADGSFVAGYAQFPYPQGGQNWSTWGVVLKSTSVNGTDRTLTHEAGHCFNLYHTFQGGCGGNCSNSGDQVCDTPPSSTDTYNCSLGQNSCSNDSPNQPDMVENYMSYDNCQNMFTLGQRARVNAAIAGVPQLQTLTSASNLIATGVDSASLAAPLRTIPVADFGTLTNSICVGQAATLLDASYNGTFDNTWTWTYTVGGSRTRIYQGVGNSGRNMSVTFDSVGTFPIKLVVRNAYGADSIVKSLITVRPATGSFVINRIPNRGTPASYQQTFPVADFNEYPTDVFRNWYTTGGWTMSTLAGSNGNTSARVPNAGTGISGTTRYLYSPSFDMSAMGNPARVYFKRALARRSQGTTADELLVQVSVNCGASWVTRLTRNMTQAPLLYTTANVIGGLNWVPTANDWVLDSLTLLNGQNNSNNMQIRFAMTAGNAQALFIDDVQIGNHFSVATPTGLTDRVSCAGCLTLQVAPNPATSATQIEATTLNGKATLSLTDPTGRQISARALAGTGTHVVRLEELAPGLAPGVYLVRIESAEGRVVRRLVVAD